MIKEKGTNQYSRNGERNRRIGFLDIDIYCITHCNVTNNTFYDILHSQSATLDHYLVLFI